LSLSPAPRISFQSDGSLGRRIGRRLDVFSNNFLKARPLLTLLAEESLDAHNVSPIVNSAKYDGPQCIQLVADDVTPISQLSLL